MSKETERLAALLLKCADGAAAVFCILAAYWLRFSVLQGQAGALGLGHYLRLLAVAIPVELVLYHWLDLYDLFRYRPLAAVWGKVAAAGLCNVGVLFLVSFLTHQDDISRLTLGLFGLCTALATGGAIVASQYLGREDNKRANVAAKQLLLVTTAMSVFIMAVCLIGRNPILDLIFGKIEPEVMDNCRVYFFWSALSYPFLAVYNAGAALYRSMGNSKVSMLTSTLMNAINIAGNALLIFGFHMGVAGAAIASLFARMVGAVLITCLLRFKPHVIQLEAVFKLDFQPEMIKNILKFGVPTGLENGMFQIGRLMTQGLVATFGLTATTANAIGMSLSAFPQIPGTAIGLAMVTVVGQCIGARRQEEAKRYTLKLTGLAYLAMGALNLVMLALLPVVIGISTPSPATAALAEL